MRMARFHNIARSWLIEALGLALLSVFLGGAVPTWAQGQDGPTGSLSGRVIDADSENGLCYMSKVCKVTK